MAAESAQVLKKVAPPGVLSAKAVLDSLGSTILILLLSPVLISVSLCVLLTMGRPVLFRQLRTGLQGKPFYILKFRTMAESGRGSLGRRPAHEEQRVTPLGRLLRLSSLDELPQLFNVWLGEMSLVGPRPQLIEFERRYTPVQARRHEVKPGITGWAQINGRNSIDWDRKFEFDVWYVDNRSLLLDLKILALTPFRLFSIGQADGPYRCSNRTFGGVSLNDIPGTEELRSQGSNSTSPPIG